MIHLIYANKAWHQKSREVFSSLRKKGFDFHRLANLIGVCERTVRDWAKGKYLLNGAAFEIFLDLSNLAVVDLQATALDDHWHIVRAARSGGRRRQELYGDLGTPEGRRRGGMQSAHIQKSLPNGFVKLKSIHVPKYSTELAEFIGIMQGDGHLGDYQVLMATHSETDMDHARFVGKLGEKLFGVTPAIRPRKYEKTVQVVFSSKSMVELLNKFGMPIGNKIDHGLAIPEWVLSSLEYKRAFIRGLFDTDGSIFLDKHLIKHKLYQHIGWTISSVS